MQWLAAKTNSNKLKTNLKTTVRKVSTYVTYANIQKTPLSIALFCSSNSPLPCFFLSYFLLTCHLTSVFYFFSSTPSQCNAIYCPNNRAVNASKSSKVSGSSISSIWCLLLGLSTWNHLGFFASGSSSLEISKSASKSASWASL